ncbi:hypothetical protein C8R43DRAFT_1237228 [Mycena crocata]|nr:hypothetical protein C8R43DRAFT_1237228 [Mycena crocata]
MSQFSELTELESVDTPIANPRFIFPNISPPELDLAAAFSASASTRPPKHYDMHLHPDLVLKQVKYLPSSMVHHFCHLVDDALESPEHDMHDIVPRLIPSKDTIEGWEEVSSMSHERSVADFYEKTIAAWATTAAFNLTFPNSRKIEGIRFTQTPSGAPQNGAISDGFLEINAMENRTCGKYLSSEANEDLALLRDRELCDSAFINWEFKSLVAGSEGVMRAIAVMAHNECPFPWTYCTDESVCTNPGQHLERDHVNVVRVTGDRRGFDADLSPFVRPSTDSGVLQLDSFSDPRDMDSQYSTTFDPSDSSTFDATALSVEEIKARHMLQQVWSQAVKHDTTFLVLHCGNFEYIGIRHRESQTLFLSELIQPSRCDDIGGYYKIHVGLYMAAMKDAIRRAKLIQHALSEAPDVDTLPDMWQFGSGATKIRRKVKKTEKKKRMGPIPNPSRYHGLHEIFEGQDVLAVESKLFPLFPGDTVDFTRCGSVTLRDSPSPDLSLRLTFAFPDTPRCYIGALDGVSRDIVGDGPEDVGRLVVKFARRPDEMARLREENAAYIELTKHEVSGILKPVVLFEGFDGEEDVLALVMPHAGNPLDDCSNMGTTAMRNVFVKILEEMHNVGFLHEKLCAGKLLVDDDLHLTIIGPGEGRKRGPAKPQDVHFWNRAVLRDTAMLTNVLERF